MIIYMKWGNYQKQATEPKQKLKHLNVSSKYRQCISNETISHDEMFWQNRLKSFIKF